MGLRTVGRHWEGWEWRNGASLRMERDRKVAEGMGPSPSWLMDRREREERGRWLGGLMELTGFVVGKTVPLPDLGLLTETSKRSGKHGL